LRIKEQETRLTLQEHDDDDDDDDDDVSLPSDMFIFATRFQRAICLETKRPNSS